MLDKMIRFNDSLEDYYLFVSSYAVHLVFVSNVVVIVKSGELNLGV